MSKQSEKRPGLMKRLQRSIQRLFPKKNPDLLDELAAKQALSDLKARRGGGNVEASRHGM